jgi:two-component system, LuxR family, response regulator FixJ
MTAIVRVAIIDDDKAVLEALSSSFRFRGLEVHAYEGAQQFLDALDAGLLVDCVVSDVRMPGIDGLSLHRILSERRIPAPFILITGHGDIQMAVDAIKAGVTDFVVKPFNEDRLLNAIKTAVAEAYRHVSGGEQLTEMADRVSRLSERQRQVMQLAAEGLTNKEIARAMDIGTRTVESYRAWVMERLGARNLADLIKIAMRLGMTK